jgi:hypothetical protein
MAATPSPEAGSPLFTPRAGPSAPTGRSSWPPSSAAGPGTSTRSTSRLHRRLHRGRRLSERTFKLLHSGGQRSKGKSDVVDTGTPESVAISGRYPFVTPGDVVEMEITHLGRQRTPVVGPA